jgi:poly(A) polymerase
MHLTSNFGKIPYLRKLSRLAKDKKVSLWLVGGALRDLILNPDADIVDFDFCLNTKAQTLAREFSKKINAKFITLDKQNRSYRVALKKGNRVYSYDFTRFKGADLAQDIAARDFTINTLAFDVTSLRTRKIVDYLDAATDLKQGRVKVVREQALIDDPLRILRAFSLAGKYNFKIDPSTFALLSKYSYLLKKVSAERINEQLFKILQLPQSWKIFRGMSKARVVDQIIPLVSIQRGVYQGGFHHLRLWQHCLQTLRCWERLFQRRLVKDDKIAAYLNQEIAGDHSLAQIIKLSCLLHDCGKPEAKKRKGRRVVFYKHEKIGAAMVEDFSQKIKLSIKEKSLLSSLVFWHLRPGFLTNVKKPSARAVYRFFRDTKDWGPAVITLALADWRATRGEMITASARRHYEYIMFKLLRHYFYSLPEEKQKPLVNGFQIMKKFKLNPSPLVGKILNKIAEERVLGHVKNKRQAYKLAKEVIRVEEVRR